MFRPGYLTIEALVTDLKLAESVAGRGHNLVLFAPPAPSYAQSLLEGLLARSPAEGAEGAAGAGLALAPSATVDAWAWEAARTGAPVAGVHSSARLARLLAEGKHRLLVTSPDTALDLLTRSALGPERLSTVLLLWPEAFGDAPYADLLHEIPRETQRVIVSSDPEGSADLIERYCWRAPAVDLLGPEPGSPAPAVRSLAVGWARREQGLLELIEQLDPGALSVFVTGGDPAGIEAALRGAGLPLSIGPEPQAAELVVAYDLPSPARLRELAELGSVVLLAPPGTEQYVARLAPARRPLHLASGMEAARRELTLARQRVAELVERTPGAHSYAALAPLFERYEATAVAASLYELWQAAGATPGGGSAPSGAAGGQIWVGIGKRDGVATGELMAVLVKECGVPRQAIGRIEIRESFSVIQLADGDAEQVVERLRGKTIRKRRLAAKLDRGRQPGSGR